MTAPEPIAKVDRVEGPGAVRGGDRLAERALGEVTAARARVGRRVDDERLPDGDPDALGELRRVALRVGGRRGDDLARSARAGERGGERDRAGRGGLDELRAQVDAALAAAALGRRRRCGRSRAGTSGSRPPSRRPRSRSCCPRFARSRAWGSSAGRWGRCPRLRRRWLVDAVVAEVDAEAAVAEQLVADDRDALGCCPRPRRRSGR